MIFALAPVAFNGTGIVKFPLVGARPLGGVRGVRSPKIRADMMVIGGGGGFVRTQVPLVIRSSKTVVLKVMPVVLQVVSKLLKALLLALKPYIMSEAFWLLLGQHFMFSLRKYANKAYNEMAAVGDGDQGKRSVAGDGDGNGNGDGEAKQMQQHFGKECIGCPVHCSCVPVFYEVVEMLKILIKSSTFKAIKDNEKRL